MSHTILYIEDNPDNMLLVQTVLEMRGYRFLWAPDGYQGIEMAATHKPDLILLDINLPDIDGYGVARRLRASGSDLLTVPIIALTANTLGLDSARARAAGCNVHLCKPINIRELLAQVMAFVPAPKTDAPAPRRPALAPAARNR